ncbi:MAG TPA: chorismate mutase [Pyrinomonadaceae bacterium]|jgi:chorismate mutase-like protein|nr:chorismate mutase [Pyrinomonadaceae bacterium]
MNIEDWRAEIDSVDDELLSLINRRARLAVEVGILKRAAGIPITDPEREREVLTRLSRTNAGPLDEAAVQKLFRQIIHESRQIEIRLSEGAHTPSKDKPAQSFVSHQLGEDMR